MKILVLNSGSSSLKYQVIETDTNETLAKGYFERIGQPNSFLTHKVGGVSRKFEHFAENHERAINSNPYRSSRGAAAGRYFGAVRGAADPIPWEKGRTDCGNEGNGHTFSARVSGDSTACPRSAR